MWLQTVIGFFSIVRTRTLPSGHKSSGAFMVRARLREHIDALVKHVPLKDPTVHADIGTDYPFRVFMQDDVELLLVTTRLSGTIDYTNFKSAVGARNPAPGYITFLHEVWRNGVSLQRRRPPRLPEVPTSAQSVGALVDVVAEHLGVDTGTMGQDQFDRIVGAVRAALLGAEQQR